VAFLTDKESTRRSIYTEFFSTVWGVRWIDGYADDQGYFRTIPIFLL
jgi:hypothetical protein